VNWFRQDENGQYLWPGYGDNSRVLKWIFERCDDAALAEDTPIGRVPARGELDLEGLKIPAGNMEKLLHVDIDGWLAEIPSIRKYFEKFGSHLPEGLQTEVTLLEQRLQAAKR
jgi:phosphoenolpyruvate carboxykinase (GTP)